MTDAIRYAAQSTYGKDLTKKAGNCHVLDIEISGIMALGGGAYSDTKYGEIRGKLRDAKGKVIGTFNIRRNSMGGVSGLLGGRCKILAKISNKLGDDMQAFFKNPTMDFRGAK